MKRIFALLLVGVLLATPVFAGDAFRKTVLASTTLDDDPTSATGDSVYIAQYDKVGIWVNYAEVDAGATASTVVAFDVSYDGSTWLDASYHDFAGGESTFVTSETISTDGNYYAWFDNANNFPYMRMTAVAANTTATSATVTLSATLSAQK